MRTTQVIGMLVIVFLVATSTPASGNAQGIPPDPGLPGPYPVDQFNFTLQTLGATVFYPGVGGVVAAGGPFPGLVLGHGFARARAQHANNGVFLASHGYVVVTCDGQVDALDLQAVSLAWQTQPGDPGYDPRFNVDGDQRITIVDVQRFASEWGWPG